jgi:hypothetical protein
MSFWRSGWNLRRVLPTARRGGACVDGNSTRSYSDVNNQSGLARKRLAELFMRCSSLSGGAGWHLRWDFPPPVAELLASVGKMGKASGEPTTQLGADQGNQTRRASGVC